MSEVWACPLRGLGVRCGVMLGRCTGSSGLKVDACELAFIFLLLTPRMLCHRAVAGVVVLEFPVCSAFTN